MQKKVIVCILTVVMLLGSTLPGVALANGDHWWKADFSYLENLDNLVSTDNFTIMHLAGARAAHEAMQADELNFERGDNNILCLTDAGYPVIETGTGFPDEYYTSEGAIDGVSASSGCTQGQGNLVLVHRSIYHSLWFVFFAKTTGECVYLEADKDILKTWLGYEANPSSGGYANKEEVFVAFMKDLTAATLFPKISQENIKPADLIEAANAEAWHHNFTDKTFGGNEFSILTISAVWAKGTSYEFVKAAELHNHICPGLTSGYFIAQYLDKNLPLEAGECYIVWAVPPWCKDDAFQQIFDATVGKRHMAVMYIPKDVQEKIYPEYQNIAGIFIKFNESTGEAQAIALGWDWSNAQSDCGISGADFKDFSTYKWWWARLRSDVILMDHEPEEYVSTLKTEDLGNQGSVKQMMGKWMAVGSNPLVELGIMPAPEATEKEVVPVWVYIVIGVLAVIAIGAIVYAIRMKKELKSLP